MGRTTGQGDWLIVRPVSVVQMPAPSLPGLDAGKMYIFVQNYTMIIAIHKQTLGTFV